MKENWGDIKKKRHKFHPKTDLHNIHQILYESDNGKVFKIRGEISKTKNANVTRSFIQIGQRESEQN